MDDEQAPQADNRRMTVPDYQTFMLPILQYLGDGATRRVVPEVTGHLAYTFGLTQEDLDQQIPSGRTSTLANRSHWAVTYMVKAGLLERPARGRVRLTEKGREALSKDLPRVDNEYLSQFPSFIEFRAKTREHATAESPTVGPADGGETPEEHLFATYASLRKSVEADLLDRLQSEALPWEFFEDLVVDLLVAMGFGGNAEETGRRVTKRSGDDGIDGVIDEDRLGLDAIYVQAKKYAAKSPVGRPALQAFAGSLEGQRAAKGVFITTSHFTGEAEDMCGVSPAASF